MNGKHSLFSLFSGAGGLDAGFLQSGKFRVVFASDISDTAMNTYSSCFKIKHLKSHPSKHNLPASYTSRVEDLDYEELRNIKPDVVVGGPPCQDFSIVRGPTARGTEVSRGKLYSYFIGALAYLQPKAFVFENVPGLVGMGGGDVYKNILEDFSNTSIRWPEISASIDASEISPEGYEILFEGLVDASAVGVPQTRNRVIILGLRKDIWKSEWLKVSIAKGWAKEILSGEKSTFKKYPLTTMEVLEGKALPQLGEKYERVMREYEGVGKKVETSRAFDWEKRVQNLTYDPVQDYLSLNGIKPEEDEEIEESFEKHAGLLKELGYFETSTSELLFDKNNSIANESEGVRERMKRIPPDENHEFVRGTQWEVEGRGMSLVYRRIHPLKPSYTIVAKGGGGTWGYHYERGRGRLTNRERARLQTFPDDFTFEGKESEVRSQIGEAVPPLLGRKIAEIIDSVLEKLS